MKNTICTLATLLALSASLTVVAHQSKKEGKAGPNGGRVITIAEPFLEFLVRKDRKVEITPLTADLKPGRFTGQIITVSAGERNKPTRLEFQEEGGKLVSSNALPDGRDYPVSVSIRTDPSAKAVYDKFYLDLETCAVCNYQEYACTCDHAKDAKEKK